MGGLGLMQDPLSQATYDQLGCDGWEITAHANSAPDHEPIQGRQYSDAAYTALNNSLRRRIGTLNCGHAAFPIILGVNSPQYTAAELERAIRRQKNRMIVDEAAGDTEKLQRDKIKLNILQQRYKDFSEVAKLRTQYERTEVAGFGRKISKSIANSLESGILNDTETSGIPFTEEAIQCVPLVRSDGWTEEQAERLQEAYRDPLRSVQDKPIGTAAGAVYSLGMSPISKLIIGKSGEYSVSIPESDVPNITIHSHPGGEIFSGADVRKFIFSGSTEMMTAVGNNGTIYAALKTPEYDGFQAHKQYL